MKSKKFLTALAADKNGDVFDLEGYGAVGMSGGSFFVLTMKQTMDIPYGSELMMLPDRLPVVYNIKKNSFEILTHNPYDYKQKIFPVAVFNAPGFVNRYFCAHNNDHVKIPLPLFSYGAVGFSGKKFRSSVFQIDYEPRQDLRCMPLEKVLQQVDSMRKKYPSNRLVRHLEKCALHYGCPAGKNFFLQRYEAPLPTAIECNAKCIGCISMQTKKNISACQDRIKFTPTPEELVQISIEHITNVNKAVVSFGQGCEGEPLTVSKVLESAISLIRERTDKGTINLNSNASLPFEVDKLCKVGLDAMRVSMNSVRKKNYTAYFRPKSYVFENVLESIDIARNNKKFVAINYLNCPGFTDSENEAEALFEFIRIHDINMIQWRNLNYDPIVYLDVMHQAEPGGNIIGMDNLIRELNRKFPNLIHGYFNPPKEYHDKKQFIRNQKSYYH